MHVCLSSSALTVLSQMKRSHRSEMQVAENTQQGAALDQETNACKTVEYVSDVPEGIMVHDLAHPPRIHPSFEDVIRLKLDTITHDQNTLRVAAERLTSLKLKRHSQTSDSSACCNRQSPRPFGEAFCVSHSALQALPF